MSPSSKSIGALGEDQAEQFLANLGYAILGRNIVVSGGEIDLIALSPEGVLVFVEVKTDRYQEFVSPALRVTPAKQKQIAKSAQTYLDTVQVPAYRSIRFDVLTVVLEPELQIRHFAEAFVPFA